MNIDLTGSEIALLRLTMATVERELGESLESGRLDGTAAAVLSSASTDARRIRNKLKAVDL
tara:strand:- start:249 stop:431 length:183 start_codon:yes stop_codon:yes gene_type:complete